MGSKTGTKLPAFCLNRIKPCVKVRGSPTLQNKPVNCKDWSSANEMNKGDRDGSCFEEEEKKILPGDGEKKGVQKQQEMIGRKIMVVIDSSAEAKLALQWALTHTVQKQDNLVLIYPAKINTTQDDQESSKKMSPRVYELLHTMKKMCYSKIPEVQVEITVAQGKEKGPAIVEEARMQGVSLLILGQKKKRSTTWRLMMMWAASNNKHGSSSGGGLVEYCVQNATCMAFAVRRRSKKVGGYLITTKRHKDFWLLA